MVCIIDTDMPDASRASVPATAVAEELLKLTSKVLHSIEIEMADLEDAQADKERALRQLVERDRGAVERATEQLNDLYRAAREIADNKGRRDMLEGILRRNVELDSSRTFDQVVDQLVAEMKLARGITGAMRVPDIGEMLNQAAVQVDHLEARADALDTNLRAVHARAETPEGKPTFDEATAGLRRDIDSFSDSLPLAARCWEAPDWSTWAPSAERCDLVRFGQFTDERLASTGVPALLDLRTDAGLLFEPGRERDAAVAAAHAVVLRLLTAFRPGSVRVTFVDPKGLGEAVTPFLGIVGDDLAVARVLTDDRAIEDALVDLAEADDDGRRHEVLVVFDHPTALTLRAITQLRSLTEAGARRGITTLVVKDPRPGRQPAEARVLPALRSVKPIKTWFSTPAAGSNWRVTLDQLPESALLAQILDHAVADVQPMSATGPVELVDETSWWTGDARERLDLHSATSFDEATPIVVVTDPSDAALTAFLHTAITEACVTYSPAELQLSLVGLATSRDFEVYGQRRSTHARLVATCADRELAVSALESAAADIARRLVLFQAAGTPRGGYREYRDETGNPLARVVVVIDDADRLFAHQDRLAQQARDLLARIALDGGSTGVHVLLAARPTNGEPRLFSELIDERVTCLTSAPQPSVDTSPVERDRVLRGLRAHADSDAEKVTRSPQVVDGRAVARLEDAPLDLLRPRDGGTPTVRPVRLWLGEPTTIGTPVEVVLQRVDGANLLVLHDQPEIAQGLLAAGLVTAALSAAGGLEVSVLDFMPLEDGFGQVLRPIGHLARTTIARRRELPETLDRMRNVVVNRLARARGDDPAVLLVLNGLDVAHDLAIAGTPNGGRLGRLEQIVREGPAVGVHTLLWGTSVATLDHHLTRDTWRGFGLRLVGPLDGTTSQAAIDSPAAASLRPNQTLLYDEFASRLVRARPYAMPDPAWLATAHGSRAAAPPAAEVTLR